MKHLFVILALVLAQPVFGAELHAIAISNKIQQHHLPFETILDPVYAAPDSNEIVGYARAGDSAIWTGHYLAAESFRYRVTASPEALRNVKRALAGIEALLDVTRADLLARCLVAADSPFAADIIKEEGRHGIYRTTLNGREYYWIGNTSRDQYSGVFFGLGIAYDLVEDREVHATAGRLVTRMLDFLLDKNWFVVMPDGSISTVFAGRPEQRLSFLIVGRRVNPGRFSMTYGWERFSTLATFSTGIAYDLLDDHSSYFKFNLNTINLYNLIRLEGSDFYRGRFLRTYDLMRKTTDDHGNVHFNMIDRALKGASARRDQETRDLLAEWLRRPLRDGWLDWRNDPRYPACDDDKACQPIPIVDRIRTDFLWQRSPFLLFGGGTGKIESAGIDYILPYWMARYYQVVTE